MHVEGAVHPVACRGCGDRGVLHAGADGERGAGPEAGGKRGQFGHSIAERKRGGTPISTQCSMSSSVLQTTRHCTRSQCQWKRTRSLHLSIAALSLRARVSNCVVEQMVMGTWRRVTSTPQLRVLFSPIYEPA